MIATQSVAGPLAPSTSQRIRSISQKCHRTAEAAPRRPRCARCAAAAARDAATLSPAASAAPWRAAACAGLASLALLAPQAWPAVAHAEEQAAAAGGRRQLVEYANAAQGYRLSVPAGWDRKDKAGADVLFEDPDRKSTSVGVTVSPVRVASIDQFGTLEAVGRRLLDTEAKKESTLDVELVAESQRPGAGGVPLYDYEYELSSTRGRKRILNTVTITGSKLYILNGQYKCEKEACGRDEATTRALDALRQVAASFNAGSEAAGGGGQ